MLKRHMKWVLERKSLNKLFYIIYNLSIVNSLNIKTLKKDISKMLQ